MKTCERCLHLCQIGEETVCVERPPQLFLAPTSEGMLRASAYPPIATTTPACGHYKLKPKRKET